MTASCSKIKRNFMYLIASLVGVAIWFGISILSGADEAWDSALYYKYGLPIMSLIAGILGYIVPIKVWRWAVTMVASQALYLAIQKPTANLLPLGLVAFTFLSLPCIATAYIGALIKNKNFLVQKNEG